MKFLINDYYKFDTDVNKVCKQKYLEFFKFRYLLSNKICDDEVSVYYPPLGVGIGNRIKNIVSALRATNSKTIHVHWADEGWVTAKFSQLFEFKDFEVIEDNNLINYKKEPDFYKLFKASFFVTQKDNVPYGLIKNIFPDFNKDYAIDCCYNDIPESVKNIYRPYFSKLKPSKTVKQRINDLKVSQYVALQVRNAPDWDSLFKNADLQQYFEIIDSYPKDTFFYLSCMNNEIFNVFRNKYGNRILQLPDKNYSSMIDATAELYIMSKAQDMVVSFASTFSECAYWLGGASANVKVVGCYDDFIEKGAHVVQYHKKIKRKNKPLFTYKISNSPLLTMYLKKIFSVDKEYIDGKKLNFIILFGKKLYIKK